MGDQEGSAPGLESACVPLRPLGDGFVEFREAAVAAVERTGFEPIHFESFPATAKTPRNACLDPIASCDVMVSIVSHRIGSLAPSGKSIVEEEFDEASRLGIPILLFLQSGDGTATDSAFVERASRYATGRFRRSFSSPAELADEVQRALAEVAARLSLPRRDGAQVAEAVRVEPVRSDEAWLRVVIASERIDPLVHLSEIDSGDVARAIRELAHRSDVRLLSYDLGSAIGLDGDVLTIEQPPGRDRTFGVCRTRIRLSHDGLIVTEQTVSGFGRDTGSRHGFDDSFVMLNDVVLEATIRSLAFASAVFDRFDPWLRNTHYHYNAALLNVGHRSLADAFGAGSYSLSMSAPPPCATAFETSQIVDRCSFEGSIDNGGPDPQDAEASSADTLAGDRNQLMTATVAAAFFAGASSEVGRPRHLEQLKQFFEEAGQPLAFIDLAEDEFAARRSEATSRAWARRRVRGRVWRQGAPGAVRVSGEPAAARSGGALAKASPAGDTLLL